MADDRAKPSPPLAQEAIRVSTSNPRKPRKSRAKAGKEPKTDTRPYEAYDPEDPDNHVMRCWYESTAKEYSKLTGMKWRKRELSV